MYLYNRGKNDGLLGLGVQIRIDTDDATFPIQGVYEEGPNKTLTVRDSRVRGKPAPDVTYDLASGEKLSSRSSDGKRTIFYHYNKSSQVTEAVRKIAGGAETKVRVEYDQDGRVSHLHDSRGNNIAILYNKIGKPMNVKLRAVDQLSLTYDKKGEMIKAVSSTPELALKIVTVYNDLLDIIE